MYNIDYNWRVHTGSLYPFPTLPERTPSLVKVRWLAEKMRRTFIKLWTLK